MKYLIALVVIVCAIRSSECWTEEMRQKVFHQMTVSCGTKAGASQADVDGILAHKPTDSPASKCLQACLGETSGVLKNKLVDPEAALGIAHIVYHGEDARIKDIEEIANACLGITADDHCDAAYAIIQCGHAKAKEMGHGSGLFDY